MRGNAWLDERAGLIATNSGLLRVAQPGRECEMLFGVEADRGEARFLWPQVLPEGRGILLTVSGTSDDADSASVVVIPAGGNERQVIVRGARAGRLTASGHLLFARGRRRSSRRPSISRRSRPPRTPSRCWRASRPVMFAVPLMDVSERGDLVYAAGPGAGNRLVWVTRAGERSDATAPTRTYLPEPVLAHDGRRAIVTIGTGDHFLWLWALDTGTLTPFVTGRDTHGPVWSPDGRKVAFPIYGKGIAIKDLESAADAELVWEGSDPRAPLAWSPDGTTLAFSRGSAGGEPEIAAAEPARSAGEIARSSRASPEPSSHPTAAGSPMCRPRRAVARCSSPTSPRPRSECRCRPTAALHPPGHVTDGSCST